MPAGYSWVKVSITEVALTPGATYRVLAKGTGYNAVRQTWGIKYAGVHVTTKDASYQGTTWGQYDASTGTFDDRADVLFLIPEPATMGLLALGAIGMLCRRRRV